MGGKVSDIVGGGSDFISNVISGSISASLRSLSPINALLPKPPKVKLPQKQTMPVPDQDEVIAARRRALAMQMARGGRASTILTHNSEKLG